MPPESPYMVGTAAGLRLGRAYARQASLRVLRQSLCLAGFTVCVLRNDYGRKRTITHFHRQEEALPPL